MEITLSSERGSAMTATKKVPFDAVSSVCPALRVEDVVDRQIVDGLAEAFERLELSPYQVTVNDPRGGAAYYFGANLYDVRPTPDVPKVVFDQYFAQADSDRQLFAEIVGDAGLPHPLEDIFVPLLRDHYGVEPVIAAEDGKKYYAPVVRGTSNGINMHTDNSPTEAPELSIGAVRKQRSLLLYLDTPQDGSGALQVFHKQPTSADDQFRIEPYGYSEQAVLGVDRTEIHPGPGDIVVFDSWNIHRVLPCSSSAQPRVTVSAFYGELPNGQIILWS